MVGGAFDAAHDGLRLVAVTTAEEAS